MSRLPLDMTEELLGLLDVIAIILGRGATVVLAFEDRRRTHGDDLKTLHHKLGINRIACRFVDIFTREVTRQFVFVIIVAAETQLFAIGRES